MSDHLVTLNEGVFDFFHENLDKIADTDDDEEAGADFEDLFYYKKHKDSASYIYHLFPKLDTRLIEKTEVFHNGLSGTYCCQTIRDEYITQIIDEFRDNDFFSIEETLKKKVNASIIGSYKKPGVRQLNSFNIQEQIEMKFVYSTWIYLWSSTFSFIDENE